MAKGSGHITEGDATFDNSSRIETKRSHQWFVNAGEPELFLNKKQAVQAPNNCKSNIEISNVACWGNTSSFPSVPSIMGQFFGGSESVRAATYDERNVSSVGTDDMMRRKGDEDHFAEDASTGLTMSHSMEDPEASCFSLGGIKKVKVNQVKDSNNGMQTQNEHGGEATLETNTDLSAGLSSNQSSYMTIGQIYGKENENVTYMDHTYDKGDANIRSPANTYIKGDDGVISLSDTYTKEDANIISFVGFHDDHEIIPVGQRISNYDQAYNQSSMQLAEAAPTKNLNAPNLNIVVASPRVAKSKTDGFSKIKLDAKSSKKEAPNSFPSNVRSLISTGMLDGVPVKYVSVSREVSHHQNASVRFH